MLPTSGLGKVTSCELLPTNAPDLRLKRCGKLETNSEGLFCGIFSAVETLGHWKSMARGSAFTKGKSVLQELLMEMERVC